MADEEADIMPNGNDNGENWPDDHSIRSSTPSFVRFVNKTARKVDIVWLNFDGIGIKYRTLVPDQFVDVNTFVGHPWIFADSDTGNRMVVQLKEIFKPSGWHQNQGWPPQRKLINITIPVYSLQERCLQEVQRLVPREEIMNLIIPESLKEDLLKPTRHSVNVAGSYRSSSHHQGNA